MSVDPDYAEIVCIGIKRVGTEFKEGKCYKLEEMEEWFNTNILEERGSSKVLKQNITIITFNGRTFDLPLLLKAGLKKGLKLPYNLINNNCIRSKSPNFAYTTEPDRNLIRHIDLIEIIGGMSVQNRKSLDDYLQIYCGIEKKTKGDEFFSTATDEELKQHCLDDLVQTEMIYNKFKKFI